jgi:sulfide:quinone oxidoreductase
MPEEDTLKRALILGGGIGGVEAAIAFRKKGFDVELVSERDYLFVYPIAIWIPVGTTKSKNVRVPLDRIAKRYGFRTTIDRVAAVSAADRTVTLERGGPRADFDVLVIAVGAGPARAGVRRGGRGGRRP